MTRAPAPTSPSVIAWRALMEAHERVMEALRPVLRGHGLSISEFDVLVNMAPQEACRHSDLADRVVLSRTALTRLVDRLVVRGLVTRYADDQDGRGVRIRLTEEGTRVRRAALAANGRVVREAFSGLAAPDVAALTALVTHIAADPAAPPPARA